MLTANNYKGDDMIYLRVRPDKLNTLIIPKEDLIEYINESPVGEKWEIDIIEMTEKEYKELKESRGF
jgi:hypothetical protein